MKQPRRRYPKRPPQPHKAGFGRCRINTTNAIAGFKAAGEAAEKHLHTYTVNVGSLTTDPLALRLLIEKFDGFERERRKPPEEPEA